MRQYENLVEERTSWTKKCACLIKDVNHWRDAAMKRTMEQNYAKLKKGVDGQIQVEHFIT
jgi:hypothetical protein